MSTVMGGMFIAISAIAPPQPTRQLMSAETTAFNRRLSDKIRIALEHATELGNELVASRLRDLYEQIQRDSTMDADDRRV